MCADVSVYVCFWDVCVCEVWCMLCLCLCVMCVYVCDACLYMLCVSVCDVLHLCAVLCMMCVKCVCVGDDALSWPRISAFLGKASFFSGPKAQEPSWSSWREVTWGWASHPSPVPRGSVPAPLLALITSCSNHLFTGCLPHWRSSSPGAAPSFSARVPALLCVLGTRQTSSECRLTERLWQGQDQSIWTS